MPLNPSRSKIKYPCVWRGFFLILGEIVSDMTKGEGAVTPASDLSQEEEWALYLERAADKAISAGDIQEACAILERALLSAPPGPTRLRLARKLGTFFNRIPQEGKAPQLLRQVIAERELDSRTRGELRLLLAHDLGHIGQVSAGISELKQAIPELKESPSLAAKAMRGLAYPSDAESSSKEHLGWIKEAQQAAAAAGDPALEESLLWDEAVVLLLLGDRRAIGRVEKVLSGPVLPQNERPYQTRLFARMAEASAVVGRHVLGQDLVLKGVALCQEIGFFLSIDALMATQLYLDWLMGSMDYLHQRAEALIGEPGAGPHFVQCHLVLGQLALAQGDLSQAQYNFRRTMELALQRGMLAFHAPAAAGLARSYLAAGDPKAAFEAAEPSLGILSRKGAWAWGADVVPATLDALIRLGDLDAAKRLQRQFFEGTGATDAPAASASLLFCTGIVEEASGEIGTAIESFESAAEAFSALPCPYKTGLAREAAGKLLIKTSRSEALEHLFAALEIEKLGFSRDGMRIRRFLRQHDVSLPHPWRGGRRSLGNELSLREKDVLALYNQGLTYRAIGERLSLSTKTIDAHLQRMRRKLGMQETDRNQATRKDAK